MRQPPKPRKRAYCTNGHEMISAPVYRTDETISALCAELGCGVGGCTAPLAEIRVSS